MGSSMRPYQLAASVLFAVVGLALAAAGVTLRLQGDFGPGPGFMAFVIGSLLAAVSALYGARVALTAQRPFAEDALPDRGGLAKVLAIVAALVVFAATFTLVGFKLSMFGFLLTAFFLFGRDHKLVKLLVALVCSFGLHFLFERVLRVPLPPPSIEALASLGF